MWKTHRIYYSSILGLFHTVSLLWHLHTFFFFLHLILTKQVLLLATQHHESSSESGDWGIQSFGRHFIRALWGPSCQRELPGSLSNRYYESWGVLWCRWCGFPEEHHCQALSGRTGGGPLQCLLQSSELWCACEQAVVQAWGAIHLTQELWRYNHVGESRPPRPGVKESPQSELTMEEEFSESLQLGRVPCLMNSWKVWRELQVVLFILFRKVMLF